MNIKTYQEFCSLDSGLTSTEYNIEYAKIFGLDLNSKQSDIIKHRKDYINNMTSSIKQHKFIKMKNKWYKVDRDIYKLTLLQWADFDNTMKLLEDKKVYLVMDQILSIFIRPCRFYKWFPKKYNQDKKVKELVKTEIDLKIAFEMTNFFFSIYNDFYDLFGYKLFRKIGKESLGDNTRLTELYTDYGWYLTIMNLSTDVLKFKEVMDTEFGTILSWLELSKAKQEIDHINNEQLKKNNIKNG